MRSPIASFLAVLAAVALVGVLPGCPTEKPPEDTGELPRDTGQDTDVPPGDPVDFTEVGSSWVDAFEELDLDGWEGSPCHQLFTFLVSSQEELDAVFATHISDNPASVPQVDFDGTQAILSFTNHCQPIRHLSVEAAYADGETMILDEVMYHWERDYIPDVSSRPYNVITVVAGPYTGVTGEVSAEVLVPADEWEWGW